MADFDPILAARAAARLAGRLLANADDYAAQRDRFAEIARSGPIGSPMAMEEAWWANLASETYRSSRRAHHTAHAFLAMARGVS